MGERCTYIHHAQHRPPMATKRNGARRREAADPRRAGPCGLGKRLVTSPRGFESTILRADRHKSRALCQGFDTCEALPVGCQTVRGSGIRPVTT
jgi:hypothetical protein